MILFFLLTFLLSGLATYLIRHYALNKKLLDIPNARSSHVIPTPRGGGLSVVIVFLIALCGLEYASLISLGDVLVSLIISSVLIAGIGFWDDHQSIPARWRFSIHILSILIILISLPELPLLYFFGYTLDIPIVNFIIYTLALAWLLNLYNFMDGIDGLASSEAISVSVNAALLLFIQDNHNESRVLFLLASCVAGFLIWNWPHAKIFMGDACSGFLGFIFGVLILITSLNETINLWSWSILLALFISDSSVTLATRVLNGEKWYEAHCSHAYQYYSNQLIRQFEHQGFKKTKARTQAHKQINLSLLAINTFWLLPWAAVSIFYPYWGVVITLIAYIPLIMTVKNMRTLHVD
ncbi:MAG: glycosyltransferase family 4 protein [Methylococcales bacterium]|nr:glycosyltransferase family 4 protein [Methylococcales bacterium]